MCALRTFVFGARGTAKICRRARQRNPRSSCQEIQSARSSPRAPGINIARTEPFFRREFSVTGFHVYLPRARALTFALVFLARPLFLSFLPFFLRRCAMCIPRSAPTLERSYESFNFCFLRNSVFQNCAILLPILLQL